MHIITICHFILYVIVYISVKRIYPSNIPFCVHLASELISVGVTYHITYHIDLRHFCSVYNKTIVTLQTTFHMCDSHSVIHTAAISYTALRQFIP